MMRSSAIGMRQLLRWQRHLPLFTAQTTRRCLCASATDSMHDDPAFRLKYTKIWLEDWVFRHELCPWAPHVAKAMRFVDITEEDSDAQVLEEVLALANPEATHKTTLILTTHEKYKDFLVFMGMHQRMEETLERKSLDDKVQIATFHPEYHFAETESSDDPSNATNKSPYPMLHLLRSDDVWSAIEEYDYHTDLIWKRNIVKMIHLGDRRISMRMNAMREKAIANFESTGCPAVKRGGRKEKEE